jgi:isoleucyl-tRNA synthetase
VKAVQRALEGVSPADVQTAFRKGQPLKLSIDGATVELGRDMVKADAEMVEGWVGTEEGNTIVLLDSRITPEIAREGVAREITRNLQLLRKTADLQIEERVVVGVAGTGELVQATIAEWRDDIAREVLAIEWRDAVLAAPLASNTAKIADGEIQFSLARAKEPS